jgi:hypothetical protein
MIDPQRNVASAMLLSGSISRLVYWLDTMEISLILLGFPLSWA